MRFALDVANIWRRRMSLPIVEEWRTVLHALAPQPIVTIELDGRNRSVYNRHQACLPSVFANKTTGCSPHNSHMTLLGAYGVLPGEHYGIDAGIMNTTLHAVWELWTWPSTWSWSWAMFSMTASRLGNVDKALSGLLMDVNVSQSPGGSAARNLLCYLPSGQNHPNTTGELAVYLPGNGGVLLAVGAMAGRPDGFPSEWRVRTEGFRPYF